MESLKSELIIEDKILTDIDIDKIKTFQSTIESTELKLQNVKSEYFIGAISEHNSVNFIFMRSNKMVSIDSDFNPLKFDRFYHSPKYTNSRRIFDNCVGYKLNTINVETIENFHPIISEFKIPLQENNYYTKITVNFKFGEDNITEYLIHQSKDEPTTINWYSYTLH